MSFNILSHWHWIPDLFYKTTYNEGIEETALRNLKLKFEK